jgi:hypothetical protein
MREVQGVHQQHQEQQCSPAFADNENGNEHYEKWTVNRYFLSFIIYYLDNESLAGSGMIIICIMKIWLEFIMDELDNDVSVIYSLWLN